MMLDRAANQAGLTARGFNRILRVGRTLADLEGVAQPSQAPILRLPWCGAGCRKVTKSPKTAKAAQAPTASIH